MSLTAYMIQGKTHHGQCAVCGDELQRCLRVRVIVAVLFLPVFFSLSTRNDFPSPTGEPICLLCKVQGHSLNFETSCRNEQPFPFPLHANPEDSNTLQVLDILKMSVFGLQSKTALSSKITCHVLCHCGRWSCCTIVPRAVSPGT